MDKALLDEAEIYAWRDHGRAPNLSNDAIRIFLQKDLSSIFMLVRAYIDYLITATNQHEDFEREATSFLVKADGPYKLFLQEASFYYTGEKIDRVQIEEEGGISFDALISYVVNNLDEAEIRKLFLFYLKSLQVFLLRGYEGIEKNIVIDPIEIDNFDARIQNEAAKTFNLFTL